MQASSPITAATKDTGGEDSSSSVNASVPLDVEAVRRMVEHDGTLMAELFRDLLPQYLLMAKDPGYRSAELERGEEMIKLACRR